MKSLFLLFNVIFAFNINAKTLIISDIDDTLKQTYVVGNKLGGLRVTNQYAGLSKVYNALACYDLDQQTYEFCINNQGMMHSRDVQLNYVTGAPGKLRLLGREFLQESGFPVGVVRGRESTRESTHDFKLRTITKLLKQLPEFDYVIMIGDNGEHDPKVYHEIEKHFPNKKIHSFIHMVYNTGIFEKDRGVNPYEGQKVYLTSADLALSLFELGLVNENVVLEASKTVSKYALSREEDIYEKVLPEWTRCKAFFKHYKTPSVAMSAQTTNAFNLAMNTVRSLCQRIKD